MRQSEWSFLHYNADLNIELFHARCIKHAFPPHMHEYYVICLIEKGLQTFSHRGGKYITPAGGLIMLNPGDDHTGEPADVAGFEYLAVYPTAAHMQEAVCELTGKRQDSPRFGAVRVDDRLLAEKVRNLYASLVGSADPLEAEALFLNTIAGIITRTTGLSYLPRPAGHERDAVRKTRQYIHAHWARKITLSDLAAHVGLSRYYLLRVFCAETGMPPHAYLDSVRMSHGKRLLRQGMAPRDVALETGFSDQSHFANRFKRLVGVTPGLYVKEFLSLPRHHV